MAKKEKTVDLKPAKVTSEELSMIQEVVGDLNDGQMQIGALELRKHELLHQVASIKNKLTELQNTLQKEYGSIDISIQDGTINYEGDVEADKKD
jgi:hypothetical protein